MFISRPLFPDKSIAETQEKKRTAGKDTFVNLTVDKVPVLQ